MSSIFHVLKEEYERLQDAEQLYSSKIEPLPKGKPRVKRINGGEYVYLNRREGAKVVDEYVGKVDSEKVHEVLKLIEARDRFIKLRVQVRARLKELKKVLRGKI